jgi:hypothetical protein
MSPPQEQQRPAAKAATAQASVTITLEEGQSLPRHHVVAPLQHQDSLHFQLFLEPTKLSRFKDLGPAARVLEKVLSKVAPTACCVTEAVSPWQRFVPAAWRRSYLHSLH